MKTDNILKLREDRVWLTEAGCDIDSFRAEVERATQVSDYPHAAAVEKNVLIYDGASVLKAAESVEGRRAVLAEICEAFATGPGVVVLKRAFENTDVIDAASGIFDELITSSTASTAAAVTISPSRVPMTASGIRWKSIA